MLLVSFGTPWKHQKTRGILMFSRRIERYQWYETGYCEQTLKWGNFRFFFFWVPGKISMFWKVGVFILCLLLVLKFRISNWDALIPFFFVSFFSISFSVRYRAPFGYQNRGPWGRAPWVPLKTASQRLNAYQKKLFSSKSCWYHF